MDMCKTFFEKDKDCVTREIAGETIIVPVRASVGDLDSIYTLNEIGTLIWQLLDGQNSVDQIVQAVCEEYDVTQQQAETDIVELIGNLEAAGLIHTSQENER